MKERCIPYVGPVPRPLAARLRIHLCNRTTNKATQIFGMSQQTHTSAELIQGIVELVLIPCIAVREISNIFHEQCAQIVLLVENIPGNHTTSLQASVSTCTKQNYILGLNTETHVIQ